ncbi:MAG: DUF885 domain-containing protein [Candidatus Neomarinimicrobiota bacterium]
MTPSDQLDNLVDRFYDDYFEFNPTLGREAGLAEYLGKAPDLGYENIMGFLKRLRFYGIEAERLGRGNRLSLQDQADLRQLDVRVGYELFEIQQLKWWANDPLAYGRHLDLSHYLKRSYASLTTRARHTLSHLKRIPHLLEQQRFNLGPVQPRINLTTTMEAFQGYRDFYARHVKYAFRNVRDARLQQDLQEAVTEATKGFDKSISYMKEKLLPSATGSFAIGRFNFIDMLRLGEMVDMELDVLLRIGETDLERNRDRFEAVAADYMPGESPRDAMLTIARNHPTSESLIEKTGDILEDMREFIVENDIVTIPSENRIRVEETPGFMRWAFAICDTPGPFEKKATESFFYVTNVNPQWSEKEKEEWLTKFDYATLEAVSIHEAYPGHFVHFLHTLRAPSKVSKLSGAYSFWEGWAHYAEEMMVEEGWREEDPEFRLAQLSEALIRNCRYVCAIQMHTQGMTVEEATEFFTKNAYMERTPARKEAERGTYDPGYLNYTLGKLMILKLRDDWKRQEGNAYSPKRFHDTLLSFGAPPIPLVRKLMLKEDDGVIV